MSILSDMFNKSLGGGNWLQRFGISKDETFNFTESWGGGNWEKRIRPQHGLTDYINYGEKWWNQIGGKEFDKTFGGGKWLDQTGFRPLYSFLETGKNPLEQVTTDVATVLSESTGGEGDGTPSTSADAEKLAKGFDLGAEQEERDRLARMRRMLAGRYGRAETNLTGGTGFGTGSQRTLGGYS